MHIDLFEALNIAKQAAQSAAKIIRLARESQSITIDYKGETDLVTSADIASEAIIIETIKKKYPQHTILSEEASPTLQSKEDYLGHLWVIDPIDGTSNFAHGLPFIGISISYMFKGQLLVGLVFNPFLQQLFTAIKGQGAYLNSKAISVSSNNLFKRSLIATGFPYARNNLKPIIKRVETLLLHCRDLRRMGAATLDVCWVAQGCFDGFYETVQPWDIAAARLIVEEAGGLSGNLTQLPEDSLLPKSLNSLDFVAATPAIYPQLVEQLIKSS